MQSLEYFAGLFDGEGWVRIDNHFKQAVTGNVRYQLTAGIAMTHMPAIRMCWERFGGFYRGDKGFQEAYAKNRIIYRWNIVTNGAYDFLKAIQPFSIVKRSQIDIAITFQEHIRTNKHKMVGARGDLALRAKLFAERATMCEQIRLLKKEEFPLVASDPISA
jgi:hypothetical protein